MKIAIISDSHDNLININKLINYLKKEKIKTVFHCGDVCSPATLLGIVKKFSGKVHLVFGNVDADQFRMAQISANNNQLKIWGESGQLEINKKKIIFVHLPELAKAFALSQKYDFVFYGHTHKPWQEKIGKTELINPGNLAGLYYQASFALYDFKKNELKLIILSNL